MDTDNFEKLMLMHQTYIDVYNSIFIGAPLDYKLYRPAAKKVMESLKGDYLRALLYRADVPITLPATRSGEVALNDEYPGHIINGIASMLISTYSLTLDSVNRLNYIPTAKVEEITKSFYDAKISQERMLADEIERMRSSLPNTYIMSNTALENKMALSQQSLSDLSELSVSIFDSLNTAPAITKAVFSFDDERIKIKPSGKVDYTSYDRAVLSGVMSLYAADNTTFTPASVYRAMNGLNHSEHINPETLEKIEYSIDKSRHSFITIDFTEEAALYAKSRGVPANNLRGVYEGYLLPAEKIMLSCSGVEVSGYRMLGKPILYRYAHATEKVLSVPIHLLQTKTKLRSTDEVIVIREFLLRTIENHKAEKASCTSLVIQYDEIYALTGANEVTHKKLRDKNLKIRQHTESLLSRWIDEGYIVSFTNNKESRGKIVSLTLEI